MNATPLLQPDLACLVVLCPTWVGDTIMATPVFNAMRKHLPTTRIVALGRSGVASLLQGLHSVDACATIDMSGVGGLFSGARQLRAHQPDAVLLLPNSFRSALITKLSKTPVRIGYGRDRRSSLLTGAIEVPASSGPTSTVSYYANLAAASLGIPSIDETLSLVVTDEEDAIAVEALGEVDRPLVFLNPGGNKEAKRWPADRFAKLADLLTVEHDVHIVLSGSPNERELLDEIALQMQGPVTNLAAKSMTLTGLKGVIQRSQLVVTNDTGPRHIAAALGKPIVSLFGPTDHRWTTLPGVNERILLAEPFLPEQLVADKHAKACAIDRIPVRDVLEACRQLLEDQGRIVAPSV